MERHAIDIRGVVQGVGFRPFVYGLATRLNLGGYVVNIGGHVEVEVEGDRVALAQFAHDLVAAAPSLARIESVATRLVEPQGEDRFRIASSRDRRDGDVYLAPDAATCEACLAEMRDPANRRYRYPFINCTACGPRLTIITGSPYDRERTTMTGFVMCEPCRSEYEDPGDRRFHAEAIACPTCGPTLQAMDRAGAVVDGDPIQTAAAALEAGLIVAVKGLGGFHLACAAGNAAAVSSLRMRKHRDQKPFAVMVADVAAAEALSEVSAAEAGLLTSSIRPIVLLRRRRTSEIADAVAPGSDRFGVMLPYTPLHALLLAAAGRALVMTSGNLSDEPIAIDNDEARDRLAAIADVFLVHDRGIHVRCEDSVVRHVGDAPLIIRRSRGYAPAPVGLAFTCPAPILAVGGQMKNTFAIGRRNQAFISHHTGDLDELMAFEAFQRDVELYERLLDVTPSVIAHDSHPDYASTRFAVARGGVRHVAVQHHHAHVASCMAEHELEGAVIGLAWDGAGWGPDGAVWGGECLAGGRAEVERVAHLRYVAQPGGDRAARQPWRMALAHLLDAGVNAAPMLRTVAAAERRIVTRMIERRLNTPMTSSVGRLFDAVAALCGAAPEMTFEGQAAMWLETLAERSGDTGRYPFDVLAAADPGAPVTIDTRPMVRAVDVDCRKGEAPAVVARRFHTTLSDVALAMARDARARTGLTRVVLSGGVFLNGILAVEVKTLLAADGFAVYRHRIVSPGDGGLSLGQLAVAASVSAPKEC